VWELIIKITVATLLILSLLLMAKEILKKEFKLNIVSIFWIIIVVITTVIPYETKYNLIATLINYFLNVFSVKIIYKISLNKATITTTTIMLIIGIVDIIISSIMMLILDFETMRSMDIMIITNLLVMISAYIFFKIRKIKEKLKVFLDFLDCKKHISRIIFIILVFLIVVTFFSQALPNVEKGILNTGYLMNILIVFVFVVLNMIYIKEETNYANLNQEYDVLFNCVKNFEGWIEEEQMNLHESKNSLASLLEITKEDITKTKIKEMLKDKIEIENKWIEQLKYIPKGGLKGILYYKLSIAKKENIKVVTDVSKDVTKLIEKLSDSELKELSRLVGIYFDNAIEASSLVEDGKISLEVYKVKESLVFTFSNNFKGEIDFDKINQKGVSTKGVKRGNGLYFASKIVGRNKNFISNQQVINDYYIQKLTIDLYSK